MVKAMVVGSEAGRETEGEADRTMRGWDPPAAARTSGHRQGDPSPQRDDTHENAKRGPHSFIDRAEAVPATTSTTRFQQVMHPCRPACLGELRDGVVRPPLQQEDSAAAHHHLVVHHGLCLQLKRGGGEGRNGRRGGGHEAAGCGKAWEREAVGETSIDNNRPRYGMYMQVRLQHAAATYAGS